MKKIILIAAMACVCLLCGTKAIAAGPVNGRNYVDADGDGICDNYGTNGNGCRRRYGCGGGYVDVDGDGICDNYGTNGRGYGRRYGCGGRYVDANRDGIYDNTKYTVRYKLNGGKNNKKNPSYYFNYSSGKNVSLKKPTRKGYIFKGWYADKKYRKKVTVIKKGSSGNKTFYAKWKKK